MRPPRHSTSRTTDAAAETAHRWTGTDHVIDGDHHLVHHVEPSNGGGSAAVVSVCRQTAATRAGGPRRPGVVVDGMSRRRGRQGDAARPRPPAPRRPGQRRRRWRTRRGRVTAGPRHPVPGPIRIVNNGGQRQVRLMAVLQPVVGRHRQIACLDALLRLHRLATSRAVVAAGARARRRLLAAE